MRSTHWSPSDIQILYDCCKEDRSLYETSNLLSRAPLAIVLKSRKLSGISVELHQVDQNKTLDKDLTNEVLPKRKVKWTGQDYSHLLYLFEEKHYGLSALATEYRISETSILVRLKTLYPTVISLEKLFVECKQCLRINL